jgi:uracil-DNA glycosylase
VRARRPGAALLVGEAPARQRNRRALDGGSGDRLAAMAGMEDRAELLRAFDAVNLLGRWPGAKGKGTHWDPARARRAAARAPLRGVCVLLGSRVAHAYGLGDVGPFQLVKLPRALAVVVPHPSGVNRLYNEAENREQAGAALREARALAERYSAPILGGVPERQETPA